MAKTGKTFTATCESCMKGVPLTRAEADVRVGVNGSFLCDGCQQTPCPRRRRTMIRHRR